MKEIHRWGVTEAVSRAEQAHEDLCLGWPDRRALPRFSIPIRRVQAMAPHELFFGYASDVSRAGMFIRTINPKPPGCRILLRFNLPPDPEPIQCLCEVVWSREYNSKTSPDSGMGLKFLDIKGDDADRIESFARRILSSYTRE
ncbi:MAG: PilZ domain-containing protein [Acidobacteria bacterium]|nr:PilZ domain-containing protein [Acidobacteriota bacterium]